METEKDMTPILLEDFEVIFSKGLKKHRLYNTYMNMMRRCYNVNNKNYIEYGERGITVCERWHSIEIFIEDMYPSFKEGLTLDRIDVNGNYEPSNCRWVTKEVQARNTRKLRKDNTSGFRGVNFNKKLSNWRTQIAIYGKIICLGSHPTPLEASYAYDLFVYYHNLEHTTNHPKESYTEEQLSQPQKPLPTSKNKSQE